jgi:hypothetical protein
MTVLAENGDLQSASSRKSIMRRICKAAPLHLATLMYDYRSRGSSSSNRLVHPPWV